MAREGEARQVPEGGGRNFGQDPEGGTVSVSHEGDPTKSGYLVFEPGGVYTINWRPTGGQVSYTAELPGASQVHILARRQLYHQLCQYHRSIAKG